MSYGIFDEFGGLDPHDIGNYETSVLIQYGIEPDKKIQMLFVDGNVVNGSRDGVFYRFEATGH